MLTFRKLVGFVRCKRPCPVFLDVGRTDQLAIVINIDSFCVRRCFSGIFRSIVVGMLVFFKLTGKIIGIVFDIIGHRNCIIGDRFGWRNINNHIIIGRMLAFVANLVDSGGCQMMCYPLMCFPSSQRRRWCETPFSLAISCDRTDQLAFAIFARIIDIDLLIWLCTTSDNCRGCIIGAATISNIILNSADIIGYFINRRLLIVGYINIKIEIGCRFAP